MFLLSLLKEHMMAVVPLKKSPFTDAQKQSIGAVLTAVKKEADVEAATVEIAKAIKQFRLRRKGLRMPAARRSDQLQSHALACSRLQWSMWVAATAGVVKPAVRRAGLTPKEFSRALKFVEKASFAASRLAESEVHRGRREQITALRELAADLANLLVASAGAPLVRTRNSFYLNPGWRAPRPRGAWRHLFEIVLYDVLEEAVEPETVYHTLRMASESMRSQSIAA
jgi:hypothetical protein